MNSTVKDLKLKTRIYYYSSSILKWFKIQNSEHNWKLTITIKLWIRTSFCSWSTLATTPLTRSKIVHLNADKIININQLLDLCLSLKIVMLSDGFIVHENHKIYCTRRRVWQIGDTWIFDNRTSHNE